MAGIGVIGGSAFIGGAEPVGTTSRVVETTDGEVVVHEGDGFVFIRRHGEMYRPPHRVAHAAHARALEGLGIDAAVGLCSVGALHAGLEPGAIVVPEDYLSLAPPPTLASGDEKLHIVPSLDPELRSLLLTAARATDGPVEDGGVYAQTAGPRFETRAEIRLLADYADVVGMTAASEATVFQEAGLRYAVLGIVDNYAHGVGADRLTTERFETQVAANRGRARAVLGEIIQRAGDIT